MLTYAKRPLPTLSLYPKQFAPVEGIAAGERASGAMGSEGPQLGNVSVPTNDVDGRKAVLKRRARLNRTEPLCRGAARLNPGRPPLPVPVSGSPGTEFWPVRKALAAACRIPSEWAGHPEPAAGRSPAN